jgi:CHAD domain-containing protein
MADRAHSRRHPDDEPTITAHELLAPTLRDLLAKVRAAAARASATAATPARAAAGYDAEAVHDLRVALRRLRTLLRPARAIYGKRRLRAVADELRRFAQATGIVRDEEVLHETLGELELPRRTRRALDAWIRSRGRHERELRKTAVDFLVSGADAPAKPSLEAALTALEASVRPRRKGKQSAASLARSALDAAIAGVRASGAASPKATDPAAMHALRIREKRLRYTAELFAEVLPGESSRLAKDAARMQKRLGELHDLDQAIVVVLQARDLPRPTRPVVLQALRAARAALAEHLQGDLAAAIAVEAEPPGDGER